MAQDLRLATLFTGSGSTMEKVGLECRPAGRLPGIDWVLAITNNPKAGGIERANQNMYYRRVLVINPDDFPTAEAYGEALLEECARAGVTLIGQYGWMPKTPENLIRAFPKRMINQHPGPVRPGQPDFGGKGMYGRRVHCTVLNFVRWTKRTDQWTEAIAQWVHPEFDHGQVLRATRVPIEPDDDVDTLQKRVLTAEHETQIQTLEDIMHDRLRPPTDLEPVVHPNEEQMLKEAKAAARRLYPKG